MKPYSRILINTVSSFLRSVLAGAMVIFSSRWILEGLGQTDYGLYNVISSVVLFLGFLNSVFLVSETRFFSIETGRASIQNLKSWFNTAIGFHLIYTLLVLVIGLSLGEWIIKNQLIIPVEKIGTCLIVFRISLTAMCITIIMIPFVAMFHAKQKISEIAGWGLLQSTLTFALAFFIRHFSGNRFFLFAAGMYTFTILCQLIIFIRAKINFSECSLSPVNFFNTGKIKKLFIFSFWNIIGALGAVGREQGGAVLLNLNFGPKTNAAYGIANQISIQANLLGLALVNAFSPEVSAKEGLGNRDHVIKLSLKGGRYGCMLLAVLAIPVLYNIEDILILWLTTVPEYVDKFCRLILITFIIDRLGTSYIIAFNSIGKIAMVQTITGIILLIALPVSALLFKLGFPPTIIAVCFIGAICCILCLRIILGQIKLGINFKQWLSQVLYPCMVLFILLFGISFLCQIFISGIFIRIFLCFLFSGLCLVILIILFLDKDEREILTKYLKKIKK